VQFFGCGARHPLAQWLAAKERKVSVRAAGVVRAPIGAVRAFIALRTLSLLRPTILAAWSGLHFCVAASARGLLVQPPAGARSGG